MKATAIANANIALVKYWGKRNKELMLPCNSSISMTTEGLSAQTTVEFSDDYNEDQLILNGEEIKAGTNDYDEYVGTFMKVVREMTKTETKFEIVSNNNFPTSAGLASSAAGFAALAAAVNKALDMGLNKKELSMLARRGSGSATRSIMGGFVEWKKGRKEDGSDSFAKQLAKEHYWPEFRMIVCVTSEKEKKIKSRAGMAQTVSNCAMYPCWLKSVNDDLKIIRESIKEKNFTKVGQHSQLNCLKMHATMISTSPPIIYWNPTTIKIMQSVLEWNEEIESYFTMDAGPQVKILCLEKDMEEIKKRLHEIEGIENLIETMPGKGVQITNKHLF